jgi:hypothetical protein
VSWIAGPALGAEPGPISAHIDWHGSVCGSAAEFAARISGRTQRVRFVPSGEQLRLVVRIEPRGAVLRANVTFRVAGKAAVLRRIESSDCDDALDALALVVAIGVDERWRERAAAPRPASPRRQPVRARPAEPLPSGSPEPGPALDDWQASVTLEPSTIALAPPLSATRPVATPPPSARASHAAKPNPVAASAPWAWAAGASARWLQGAAPAQMFGAELWLRASWERGSMLSPDFSVSVAHDRASGFERPEGDADFALSAAGAELCPMRFGVRRLRLQPCVASTFGWLRASGRRTFRGHTQSSPWLTLGGGAQLMASIGSLALRVAGGAAHPFQREGYRFLSSACRSEDCDEAAFHRVAPVVWSIALGAGLSF